MPAARVAETSVLPQVTETNEPQDPENSCSIAPEEFKLEPIVLRVTVIDFVEGKVNEYQTSSSGFPVAQPTGMLALAVALLTVPEGLVIPRISTVADPHSSLPGGGIAPNID